MASKSGNVFFASEELEAAYKAQAAEEKISASELVRKAVAAYIGYDLDGEPAAERRRKYANKAERDKAMRERAKSKRATTKAIMDAINAGKSQAEIVALARTLAGKSETADAIVEAADEPEA